MPSAQDAITKILNKHLSGTVLPDAIPDSIDDRDLIPQLGQSDHQKLIEYKIRVAAKEQGLDPHLAAGVGMTESSLNADAKSPTGVKGPLQVSGIAAKDVGFDPETTRADVDTNIRAGIAYLKKHGLDKYPDPNDRPEWIKKVNSFADKSRKSSGAGIDNILAKYGIDTAGVTSSTNDVTTPNPTSEYLPGFLTPKTDASSTYDPTKTILDLLNPAQNTGKKALSAAEGFLGRPFSGPPTALDAARLLVPGLEDLENRSPAKQVTNSLTSSLDKVVEEEPIANALGQVLSIGTTAGALKVGKAVKESSLVNAISETFGIGSRIKRFKTAYNASELDKLGKTAGDAVEVIDKRLATPTAQVRKILAESPAKIDMKTFANDSNILDMIGSFDNAEDRGQATKLLNRLAKFEKRGNIPVADADKLKKDFFNLAYTESGKKNTALADFYNQLGGRMARFIEIATADPTTGLSEIGPLNEATGKLLDARRTLSKLDRKTKTSKALEQAVKVLSGKE